VRGTREEVIGSTNLASGRRDFRPTEGRQVRKQNGVKPPHSKGQRVLRVDARASLALGVVYPWAVVYPGLWP